MKKQDSLVGVIVSVLFHISLFSGLWLMIHYSQPKQISEEVTSISIEMMTALLEQPQVAVAPESEPEEVIEEPIPEPDLEPEPVIKPKEKPKPKPKEKPKEKPKPKEKVKKEKPPVKALEKGPEAKQGIVAKAIPDAFQGTKLQAGTPAGSPNSTNTQLGSSDEINAYKAKLRRLLQQRANSNYPNRERSMRKTGNLVLSFSVSPSGQLINISVHKSSGNSNFDSAAIRAAEKTNVGSSPPTGFPRSLTVPVSFSLTDP